MATPRAEKRGGDPAARGEREAVGSPPLGSGDIPAKSNPHAT